jgi:hypothetical protein
MRAKARAPTATTDHQRREGRWPVGKRRMPSVLNRVKAGTHAHVETQDSEAARGRSPDATQKATVE